MSVQMISYDLRKPGQEYAKLFEAIKGVGPWWHHLQSVWLVKTNKSSSEIRDILRSHLDTNDSLLVAVLSGDWATLGLSGEGTDWLRHNLSR